MKERICPVPDEIRRSARKTLALEIRPDGTLLVRAPLRMSRAAIDRFLREKADWIVQKQQAVRGSAAHNELVVEDGARWPFYGDELCLQLTDTTHAVYDADTRILRLPAAHPAEVLENWLREQTRRICTEKVQQWAAIMGVTYATVKVTGAQSRWGSCSSQGSLNFSWHLILCPPAVVEYVVIHELCHRRHMDHSPAFWKMVEQYCPEYTVCKQWLRKHRWLMLAGKKNAKK